LCRRVAFGPRYTSSLIGGYIHVCRDPKCERPAFLLVRGHMVGLGGLEPPTSSLSEIEGSALCYPAFPLVALLRKSYRDEVNSLSAVERPAVRCRV
jgi:hypothetical protein